VQVFLGFDEALLAGKALKGFAVSLSVRRGAKSIHPRDNIRNIQPRGELILATKLVGKIPAKHVFVQSLLAAKRKKETKRIVSKNTASSPFLQQQC